jgi:hypothetical protein
MKIAFPAAFLWLLCLSVWAAPCRSAPLELSTAVVVAAADATRLEQKAVEMLVDEVHKRTQIRWNTAAKLPAQGTPAIVVARLDQMPAVAGRFTEGIANAAANRGRLRHSSPARQRRAGGFCHRT